MIKEKELPKCEVCGNPIYNPAYWEIGLCGSCATGEADETLPILE